MIKLTNSRLLAMLCLILAIGVLASCEKDNDKKNDGTVQLLSFGPTGARHGDTIRFFGQNLDKVTEVVFTGTNATVKQSDFKQQSVEQILLLVPQTAEKGFVTLKTSQGDVVSKTQFNLNVKSRVTVTTINPPQARPGENITLNGNYMNWVKSVTFAKNKVVASFVSKSLNQLVVAVPADAQTGPLLITYSGTDSADFETTDTLKVTLPLVAAMAPQPVKPGTNVTLTGTDLDLVKKVFFNGVPAALTTFVSQSATELVLAVPATAKKGKVVLEAASGVQTTSGTDLDMVLPMATTLAPATLNLGDNLTLTGTDLDLVKKVIFSGVAAPVTTFESQTATQLVVKLPGGARNGQVTLEAFSGVQTTGGSGITVILPTVTSLAPNPVDPGANLTITGTRLDMVKSVAFQNAPAVTTFVSQSPTQIVVVVPAGVMKGKIALGLSNPTDTVQSTTSLEITGEAPPPSIAFPLYTDAVTSNWNGWVGDGWGGTKDYGNTTPVREGAKSIKVSYVGGWGAPLQLGHSGTDVLSTGSYTTFKLSLFGAPGSNGKKVNIGIDGADKYTITVVEGKWTDYEIPLSNLTSTGKIKELILKEYSGTGGFTVYVDAVGLN